LSRIKYEELIYSHPILVYRFSQGLVRYVHHIMRHLNTDLAVLNKQITCTGVDYQMRQGSVPVANRAAAASCTTIAREVVTG
jgi:hypothetical protein